MSDWVNIAHKKPAPYSKVLVFIEDEYESNIEVAEYMGLDEWRIGKYEYINSTLRHNIRYWQELPPFPLTSKKERVLIETLRTVAEGTCLCSMGCPRCDAVQTLNEMGISL